MLVYNAMAQAWTTYFNQLTGHNRGPNNATRWYGHFTHMYSKVLGTAMTIHFEYLADWNADKRSQGWTMFQNVEQGVLNWLSNKDFFYYLEVYPRVTDPRAQVPAPTYNFVRLGDRDRQAWRPVPHAAPAQTAAPTTAANAAHDDFVNPVLSGSTDEPAAWSDDDEVMVLPSHRQARRPST